MHFGSHSDSDRTVPSLACGRPHPCPRYENATRKRSNELRRGAEEGYRQRKRERDVANGAARSN